MSNATDRAAIVDALKTVPALAPSGATPDTIMAMAAWPAWSSTSWINACLTTSEWFVFVVLPNGDTEATVDAGDDVMEDVSEALWAIGKVVRREPWRIPMEPGQQTVPVVRFTMEI